MLWAHRKLYSLIAAVFFALITFYALFKLPFLFPPRQRLWSASFAFGFHNGISVICFAALLGIAASVLIWLGYNREPPIRFPLEIHPYDRRSIKVALGVLVLMYAGLTFGMYVYYERSAPPLMWEVRHFLHRTDLMEVYGLRAYSQFQAEYGPLLTHTPLYVHFILKGIRVSLEQAYFTSHYLLNVGGLACIYYLLSRAAIGGSARAVAFVAVAIAGFGMWMGLNGVLLRYLCPFASLLFGHHALLRMHSYSKVSFGLFGTALVLVLLGVNTLLSPEAAAAFVVAWFGQAALMLRSDARVLAVSVLATVFASILIWALLPPEYYSSLLRFAEGANNLPLLPAAHLLLFTVTMFLIVPALLAAAVRSSRPSAAISGGFGILCIAMAPGALGRCDPPHVLFFSMEHPYWR